MSVHRSILVDRTGVFVYNDDLTRKRRTPPGWDKGWICENVYGWQWVGPLDRYPYRHLITLPYEPRAEERAQIEARIAKVATPDGAPELRDPWIDA